MNNDIIHILSSWGSASLLDQVKGTYAEKLQAEYPELFSEAETVQALQEAIEALPQRVTEAIETLSSNEIFTAQDGSAEWDNAIDALETLDEINYLLESLLSFPPLQKMTEIQSFVPQLDALLQKAIDWIYADNFSPLRLTFLNEIRSQRIELFAEDKRHLFPWYELLADYDPIVVPMLINDFEAFQSGSLARLPQFLQEHIHEIKHELALDQDLFAFIQQEYAQQLQIKAAIEKPSALRLLMVAEENAHEHPVAPEVMKSGLYRTAAALLDAASKQSKLAGDRLYFRFLAAFCGPGLSDAQRLTVFDDVAQKICHISLENCSDQATKVVPVIGNWFRRIIDDDFMAAIAFKTWSQEMVRAAKTAQVAQFEDTAEQVWAGLQQFMQKPDIPDPRVVVKPDTISVPHLLKDFWDRVQSIAKLPQAASGAPPGLFAPSISPRFACELALGSGSKPFPVATDQGNYLVLPWPAAENTFLNNPGQVAAPEVTDAYNNAYNIYSWFQGQDDEHCYCACFIDKSGKITASVVDPKRLPRSGRPIKIDVPEGAVVCVIAIGRTDDVRAEPKRWRSRDSQTVAGESPIFIFGFVKTGS